jgi:hypothetical protein
MGDGSNLDASHTLKESGDAGGPKLGEARDTCIVNHELDNLGELRVDFCGLDLDGALGRGTGALTEVTNKELG